MAETLLYGPVKRFIEGLGFSAKGEIGGCDLLALSSHAPPIVVVCELKREFNLELVLQAVDREAAMRSGWRPACRSSARGASTMRVSAICAGGLDLDCSGFPPTIKSMSF